MREDDILLAIEQFERRKRDRLLAYFVEIGRPDVAAELVERFRQIELGIVGAQGTWHALSPAQRRTLDAMGDIPLFRLGGTRGRYAAAGTADHASYICGLPTARNLCARDLITPTGGAFDPEAKFAITERGRFVRAHGRAA